MEIREDNEIMKDAIVGILLAGGTKEGINAVEKIKKGDNKLLIAFAKTLIDILKKGIIQIEEEKI